MVKENYLFEVIKLNDFKDHESFHLINCIVNTIDLNGSFELHTQIIIENCLINNLQIHSCWFTNGLILKNCIIKNYVDYQMGGHNNKPILIEGSIFHGFVNFFDCQFNEVIEVNSNIFLNGTNLLGNKNEGFVNTFEKGWIEKDNIGNIEINGLNI